MSLYRKYRPQSFAHLVGQDHVRITLLNALKSSNVNHAYLFTGPRGTGKTSTARLLAKAINCENLREAEPCEKCDICVDITQGRLIDLLEIDAASNRGIDEIRDLREKIQFSPTRARSKVYIIDEVHMLTKEAFNALLKTLEEPPTHVYFILATTEVHKIPETILSRCQRFDFKRIDDKTLLTRLAYIAQCENIEAELAALEIIGRSARGGLRDGIGLLEQLTVEGKLTSAHVQEILGISGRMSIEKLYDFLQTNQIKSGIDEVQSLYIEGYDLSQFNKDFLEFLRQKMLASVHENKPDETDWLLKLIGFFQQAYEQLRFTTIPQLPLEMAIIQSCQEPTLDAIPQLVPAESAKTSAPAPKISQVTEPAPEQPLQRYHQSLVQADPSFEERKTTENNSTPTDLPSLDQVKNQWPRVLEHITNPIAKRTLMLGIIADLKGSQLQMNFKTNFDLGKIKEMAHLVQIEKALESVFQARIKFVPKLEEVPSITPNPDSQTSQLLEVFGGELVEEDKNY